MIDLTNTTFMIPIMLDSDQRRINIKHQLRHLTQSLKCVIKVIESDTEPKLPNCKFMRQYVNDIEYSFVPIAKNTFHRTKLLNLMTRSANTPVVVIHDADVFIHQAVLQKATAVVLAGLDVCYPYIRYRHISEFDKIYKNSGLITRLSLGGSVFCNRESYMLSGMENERCVSWGCEDVERYSRWCKFGFTIARIDADLYHLEHPRPVNSSIHNPHYKNNQTECDKVSKMSREQLLKYVESWEWANV